MTEPTHAEILGAIKTIQATLVERRTTSDVRRQHLDTAIGDIKDQMREHGKDLKAQGERIRKVERVAAYGEGAGWMALKIGGLVAMAIGAAAWVWDRIKSVPH